MRQPIAFPKEIPQRRPLAQRVAVLDERGYVVDSGVIIGRTTTTEPRYDISCSSGKVYFFIPEERIANSRQKEPSAAEISGHIGQWFQCAAGQR